MIFDVGYRILQYDFYKFIFFLGMISVNLAVINFLPIPVLDGGHFVFLLYEGLRGKPAPEKVRIATTYVEQLNAAKSYPGKIVTQIAPFSAFYRAEEYHQDYLKSHTDQPYIVYNDLPKLAHLKKQFPELYREN